MNYLAIDLGAESGRVILGSIDLNAVDRPHVSLKELQRFPNAPTRAGASLHWNIQKLWDSVAAGVMSIENDFIDGISVDSWGVDYVLLDAEGKLMEPTFHYRDPRSGAGVDAVLKRVT